MKYRNSFLLLWATIVFICSPPPPRLAAQTADTGAVTGTLTNQSGAVIPSLTVTLTNNSTGDTRTDTTNTSGSFQFIQLPPGDYKIRFSGAGFTPLEIESFTVNVGETPTINRILPAGNQNSAPVIEVRAENLPLVGATGGATLSTEAVNEVPLATRNATQTMAENAGSNASLANATSIGRNDTDMSAGGASTGQNAFQMDGVNVVTWSSSGSAVENGTFPSMGTPSPDAIQELKVDTTGIDAAYGRQPGAHVNMILRSGGNNWHGSAFEFFRNTALNANEYFRELTCNNNVALCAGEDTKLALNQNQFGGVAGGPLKKNKLYVFVSYQQTWQKNGFASGNAGAYSPSVFLPPFATSAGTNDWFNAPGSRSGANAAAFEASLGAIYSHIGPPPPAPCDVPSGCYPTSSYNAGAASTGVNSTGGNINPIAVRFLQATLPNGNYVMPGSITGATENVSYTIPAYFPMYQGIGNFDYYLTPRNTFSGRYFHQDETQEGNFAGTQTNLLPGTPATLQYVYQDYLLRLTSVVNEHVVNEVRFSWQLHGANFTTFTTPSFLATNIYSGLPVVTTYGSTSVLPGCGLISCTTPGIDPAVTFAPNQSISSNYAASGCSGCDSHAFSPQFQAADNISWTHGRHSVRFGFEYDRVGQRFTYWGLGRGIETFNSFQDFLMGLSGNCGGYVMGSCNGGTLSNIQSTVGTSLSQGPQGVDRDVAARGYSAYIQDDIKVNKRLTVNIGLRWEYNGEFWELGGNNTDTWLQAINLDPHPVVNTLYTLGTYYGYGPNCLASSGCLAPPMGSTYTGYVVPINDDTAAYGPVPAGVLSSGKLGIFPNPNSQPLDDFGPRLGFAYSPFEKNKLVLRAGVGYFYSRNAGTSYLQPTQSPPSVHLVSNTGPAGAFSSEADPYAANVVGTFPVRWVNPNTSLPSYQQSSNNTAQILGFNVSPLVYTWNLTLQYELAPTWVFTASYQGSQGIHQLSGYQAENPAIIASAANPITIPGYNGGPATVITSSSTANASLRVPYLGFAPGGLTESFTDYNYKFNSLAVSLNKRLSHGLSFNAAYTFSRAFIQSNLYNNPSALIYTPNSGYRPQRFIVRYSWNIPGSSLNGIAGKVLGGWSVAGVATVQDGTPLTFTDTRLGSVFGLNGTQTMTADVSGAAGVPLATAGPITSRLGGSYACLPVNPCPSGYINKGYFITSASGFPTYPGATGTGAYGYGTSGVGILLGPGQFNFDASLTKTMVVGGLRENARLQFRTEFYNMFNHPQFGNPAVAANNATSFGTITTTSVNPRLVQFGLKYLF